MKFQKGDPRPSNSGRKKGSTNKATAEIKDMIRNALDLAGGEECLLSQAKENPTAFLSLIGKIIPKDLNVGGQEGNPVRISKIESVGFDESTNSDT